MLRTSFLGAAGILFVWTVALAMAGRARGRQLTIEVALRKQHYLQACAQASVLLYWGWYWREVYDAVPLIAAQLAFAYAFDILLAWSRRDVYTLGFAPFPVVFSINLFLWFKPDWFYLQFLMLAVGFAAKELIRWNKDGRRAHIFNPSSFPLSVFSIGLILTATTSWTWGPDIARTQFNPPYIYLFLFLIGLPGQFLFGVTTMTMSAVLTTYLLGLAYVGMTGTYYFIDSYVPIAVFLGMHLLFTDPSTSPRTELGRIIFGIVYGASVFVLYDLLARMGIPTFYDKLLPVPIMNLSIKGIDRLARSRVLRVFDPGRLGQSLRPRQRNLAYMGVWAVVFVLMSAAEGVGDSHPGHVVPFWQNACRDARPNGCATLQLITKTYCDDGSGWACNEHGVLLEQTGRGGPDDVRASFQRSCALGFAEGCENGARSSTGRPSRRAPPGLPDYPVVLRQGKGAVPDRTPLELYTRACSQGWMEGCESLGGLYLTGEGVPRDPKTSAGFFETACEGGLASSCSNLGLMYYKADGLPRDEAKGLALLKRSCDMGFSNGCRWYAETTKAGS
jgi:hypothetical protein